MAQSLINCSKLTKNYFCRINSYFYRSLKLWVKSDSIIARSLVYPEYGNPTEVVKEEKKELLEPKDNEVLVKMLAAPVNPADINTIQGVYPVKPRLPAIGGNEGVGEVVSVGEKVKDLQVGDRVVPSRYGWGTWRSHAVCPEEYFIKVPKELSILQAATLTVNPCTAYLMLKNFVKLNPGDVVIQNAANGSCGTHVIQLCKIWGIHTVNIVRQSENLEEVKTNLYDFGATYVITEEETRTFDLFKTGRLLHPKLALNAVGGKNAMQMFRHLDNQGVFVTYGGMSRQPVMVPTGVLIFGDVKVVGFWLTRLREHIDSDEWATMFDELITLMISGRLKPPCHQALIPFSHYQSAMENTLKPDKKKSVKYVLDFSE